MMAIAEQAQEFGKANHTSSNQCGVTLMNRSGELLTRARPGRRR